MSTFREPVGPQPKSVYWRRRLVVGGVLAAIIVIIALIAWPRGAATPDKTPASESAPAGDQSEAPTEAAASAPCDPARIELLAITDSNNYGADQYPQLSLAITNLGKDPCSYNVGTSQQLFTVSSGEETYWLSTDCQQNPADQLVELRPAEPVRTTPIEWSRTRSSTDTCDQLDKPKVPAGGASYKLTVKVGEVTSPKSVQFLLY